MLQCNRYPGLDANEIIRLTSAIGHNLPVRVTFQFLLVVCSVIELNGRYSASKLMTSLPQPGHLRSVETGKRPNFERQVTGRHLLYAIPTRKSADLASAGHEYRWTNVEELGQLSRQARYAAVQFMLLVLSR